jgi:transposase
VANGAIAAWCAYRRLPKRTAKRPNRERECLVKERTRLVNRMKGTLARLGIRNFRPTLRNAAKHLAALSTPEGSPLPPNDRLDARNRRRESHAEPQNPEWQPPALANQSRA